MIDLSSRLNKVQMGGILSIVVSIFFTFIAVITPAWQVAEDLDVNRYVQSGLWMYCPGATQCWYIFSDNLINYYERVDVCRFLLIGDCRKKLLRTPYFFGWHYAVLILTLVSMGLATAALVAAAVGFVKRPTLRITTIIYDILVFMAFLILAIGLTVFVVNAEMLESRYLIGVKNTFEKQYGYSFYLAGFALLTYSLAFLFAILLTTFVFFAEESRHLRDKAPSDLRRSQQIQSRAMTPTRQYAEQRYYADEPGTQQKAVASQLENYLSGSAAARSASPMSVTPSVHGQFIPPQTDGGEFQPTTRYFFSY